MKKNGAHIFRCTRKNYLHNFHGNAVRNSNWENCWRIRCASVLNDGTQYVCISVKRVFFNHLFATTLQTEYFRIPISSMQRRFFWLHKRALTLYSKQHTLGKLKENANKIMENNLHPDTVQRKLENNTAKLIINNNDQKVIKMKRLCLLQFVSSLTSIECIIINAPIVDFCCLHTCIQTINVLLRTVWRSQPAHAGLIVC